MNYEKLRVRKLSPAEHIDSFDCGDEDLNSFILEEAPAYRKALLAVTYVVEDKLCVHQRTDMPVEHGKPECGVHTRRHPPAGTAHPLEPHRHTTDASVGRLDRRTRTFEVTVSLCTSPIIPPALCEQPQEAGGFLFPVCQYIEKYTGTGSQHCRLKRYSVLYRTTAAPRQSANSCKHDLLLLSACAFFDRQEKGIMGRNLIIRSLIMSNSTGLK